MTSLHDDALAVLRSWTPPNDEQAALRYTSTVVNCPPEQVAIDMPVQLTWIERHGAPFPVFEPAQDQRGDS